MKVFLESIEKIYAVFIDTNIAFLLLNPKIKEIYASDDDDISFVDGSPNDPQNKIRQTLKVKTFKERIKFGGEDTKTITNLCVASLFSLWEDKYREVFAKQLGLEKKEELKSDLWGDIRHIRQAIIHNRGLAISDFKRMKLLKYMIDREEVYFSPDEFHELVDMIKSELSILESKIRTTKS